jgi:hypothetical protein
MRPSHLARGDAKLSPFLDDAPTFVLKHAETKLRRRGGLPGAFGYDLAADAFRHAIARGVPPQRLLAAAMPASWMVNNRAASTVFQKWLCPPHVERWERVLMCVSPGYAAWGDVDDEARSALSTDVEALCIDGHGVAALSKVLALLAPQTVPLMDDSAVSFLIGGVPMPADDRTPTAGPEHFVPMLDAFAAAVLSVEGALVELARGYDLAPLDAPQVLDRVLWYDSFGHRHWGAIAV